VRPPQQQPRYKRIPLASRDEANLPLVNIYNQSVD
jgi:hypothetical protein